jgi:DNA mismatch endonuclease (patch repair protein)
MQDVLPILGQHMADTLTTKQRSYCMSRVKGKNTEPELVVRRFVHSQGYRYRLHVASLPGTPDIVFPSRRKVIEVRGCFWHMHECGDKNLPKSRRQYWRRKLKRNKMRDVQNEKHLRMLGWRTLVVWGCENRNLATLQRKILRFLAHKNLE